MWAIYCSQSIYNFRTEFRTSRLQSALDPLAAVSCLSRPLLLLHSKMSPQLQLYEDGSLQKETTAIENKKDTNILVCFGMFEIPVGAPPLVPP